MADTAAATASAPAPAPAPAPAAAAANSNNNSGAAPANGEDPQVHRSAALYVGDLAPQVNEADLFEIFNAVASVASVRVCRHAISRQSLGYAYVNFHTIADAEKVLDTMNYTQIKGRMSRLSWSHRDPSFRRAGNGNVFIKNLEPSIDSKDLNDTFSIFGNIISCKVATDRETGKSRGYGFVHFEKEEEAQEAIAKVNGQLIADRQVFVGKFEPAERRHKKQQWTNLFVKNIPADWNKEKLRELFEPFGEITSITIVTKEERTETTEGEEGEKVIAKQHKGYGFVDFAEHEAALKAAQELNGKDIPGEFKQLKSSDKPVPLKLYVGRFQKKRERLRHLQERRQQEKQARIKEYLGKNLHVRNLHEDCTDEMLRKEFSPHGTITSARVMKSENGQSRGFGFVCFSSQAEASKALKALQGVLFMNKPLYIAMWQPREERQQFLRRQHEARMPNRAMPGPGGLMPMMNPGYPMPMFAPPIGGYPRPMYGRGPAGNMQGGRGGYQGYPQQNFGRGGMMGGRGGGRGRGRGRGGGRGDPQMMMAQQHAMEQQQQQLAQQQAAQLAQQQAAQAQAAAAQAAPTELNPSTLAHATPEMQKNMIGEKLYPLVQQELQNKNQPPARAGKITGMLLDGVETTDLLHLLEAPQALQSKVDEALAVLIESAGQ
eukprot:INCI4351.1.p1 GENE.INCI4351.1~~INCI4351.1.p1  ORF type:complete len:661 (-),score=134.62 INCI4351.1:239-2221(-)